MRRIVPSLAVCALVASGLVVGAASAATAADPYVLEAENMTLSNFTTTSYQYLNYVKNNAPLETDGFAVGVLGQTSTATSTFSGAAGTYDLITRYAGRNADTITYSIAVNNVAVDTWKQTARNVDWTDPKSLDNHTSSKVVLAPGDTIKLTAVSVSEVPHIDKITIQAYVGAPTSTLTLDSPNSALNDGFTWGKNRALGMVFYPGNPMLGHDPEWWRLTDSTHTQLVPGYWGAYESRESFYTRDIAHQSDGAHVLGLDDQTFSMMKTFAADAALPANWTEGAPAQDGWPMWAHSSTGRMYYVDGWGMRELPFPYNLMSKMYQQYLWSGDSRWINDPDMSAYYDSTVGAFSTGHGVVWDDANPANDQPIAKLKPNETLATYYEYDGEHLVSAADSIGYEYSSLVAYAGIQKAKGNSAAAATWASRAQRLKDYYESHWYDASTGHYARGQQADGTLKFNWGQEASYLGFIEGLGDNGSHMSSQLDFIDANDNSMNVEATTYLPELYFKHNRNAAGWAALKTLLNGRNSYPEVSFLSVSNSVSAMMGIQPDAPNGKVTTASHLTSEVPWVEVNHIKLGNRDLKLRHDGTTSSTLTNNSGSTVTWEAQFYGTPSTLYINGSAQAPQTKAVAGGTAAYATVTVAVGQTVTVSTTQGGGADTTAPSAPTNLAASSVTSSGLSLGWTASPESDVAGYDVYQGSTKIGSTSSTSYAVTGLSASTAYSFTVKAKDTAGNVSAASNTAAVTTSASGGGSGAVYVSDLTWSSATSGWGAVTKDKSVESHTLTLNGTTYTKGIGTHATSSITYALGGNYSRFQSDVGADDEVTANATVGFEVWGDGVKLYDSGTMTPTTATKSIDISVAGVNSLVLKVNDGGDGINSDHADWAGAKLLPKTSTTTDLSALTWSSATIGWGSVMKDKSVDSHTLTLNGTTYAKGIGTHATSAITYALGGTYSRFTSDVGVDDEVTSNATISFEVWGDGVKLYDSGAMTPTTATKSIDISVAGVNSLVLKVNDGGDGINSDHGDWAGAQLVG